MTDIELYERVAKMEEALQHIREAIDSINEKLRDVNGIKIDVGKLEERLEIICDKLDEHKEEHRLVWQKAGIIATIVSVVVSSIVAIVSWLRSHI